MTVGSTVSITPYSDSGVSSGDCTACASGLGLSDGTAFTYTKTEGTVKTGVKYYTFTLKALKEGSYTVSNSISYRAQVMGSSGFVTETASVRVVYNVTVNNPPVVTRITIPSQLSLNVGDTYTFSPIITESGATTTLSWKSSKPDVATITDEGVLTANGVGTTEINCTASNGVSAQCVVTVNPVQVTSITLNMTNAVLSIGDQLQLTATVAPNNASDKSLMWISSKPDVATITDKGLITANAVGTTEINCTASNGVSAQCVVTVNPVQVTSITLNKSYAELTVGDQLQLTATVKPTNAQDKSVTWSSTNEAVAVVNESGKVYAVGTGFSHIKAKANDGSNKTASCLVTVKDKTVLKGDVNLDNTVDVADIATIIDVMAGVSSALADVNKDGNVDVADIATVIDIMAGGGSTEPGGDDTPLYNEIVDAEVDFSQYTDFSEWHFKDGWGSSSAAERLSIQDGCLHFESTEATVPSWDCQFTLIGGIKAEVGVTYTLHYKIKGDHNGKVSMLGGQFQITTEWVEGSVDYKCTDANSGAILMQCGDWVGTWDIAYLIITHKELNPDVQWVNIIENGGADATWEDSNIKVGEKGYENVCAWSKEWGYLMEDVNADAGNVAIPRPHPALIEIVEGDNVFVCHAKAVNPVMYYAHDVDLGWMQYYKGDVMVDNAWQNMFWINMPRTMETGEKVKISFRYKASRDLSVNTEYDTTPGNYLGGGFGSQINFTTKWQTFEQVISAKDGMQSIGFYVSGDYWRKDIDFYFDDISVSLIVPE